MLFQQINPHGGDTFARPGALDFSANINPFGMPEPVREAALRSIDAAVAYPDPYCRSLKTALAEKKGLDPDSLLFGNGAAELIFQFAASLPKGKKARIVCPAFSEYETALQAAGIPAEPLFLSAEKDFVPDEDLLRADPKSCSALFVCTPNNPTGQMLPPGLLEALAARYPAVLCDLSFLELSDHPGQYDIPALSARHPNIVFLFSFTKSYAVPGLRLGYAVCRDRARLKKMSEASPCWNVSVPAQAAGLAALDCEDWLKDCAARIRRERERLKTELSACGLKVLNSEANFLFFHSEKPLAAALAAKNILIRDCSNFRGLKEGYYRAAVRTRPENDRLAAAIREVLL
jgi:threonine-phosphate decarboxylase